MVKRTAERSIFSMAVISEYENETHAMRLVSKLRFPLMRMKWLSGWALVLSFWCCGLALGNPEPDVPVMVRVLASGEVVVTAEVDPRCFSDEPMAERWFMKVDVDRRAAAELEALKVQVREALAVWVRFETNPKLELKPTWELSFTGRGGQELLKPDDPVMVRAVWRLTLPQGTKGWRVCAVEGGRFAVVVRYALDDRVLERVATLFPGECAFWLELPGR